MIRNSFEWFTRWRRWAPRCRGNKRTDVSRGDCRSYYFIITPGPIRPRVKSPVDDSDQIRASRLFPARARTRATPAWVSLETTRVVLFPSCDSRLLRKNNIIPVRRETIVAFLRIVRNDRLAEENSTCESSCVNSSCYSKLGSRTT